MISCGGIGFVCVVVGLLVGGRLGQLATFDALFAVWGSMVVLCVVLVCCICFMSCVRILASVDCPILWRFFSLRGLVLRWPLVGTQ